MIWVDREAKKIKERELPLEWVDDMKTPSGRIHVGSLRGVVIHDLIYKALLDLGVKAKFTYVFDDHDPMDALPSYLDEKKWNKYMGMQLYKIPSPEKGFKNFAECYALEFQHVFNSINCHPEIIWASELYSSGRMNTVIKEILDNVASVREIYAKIYDKKIENDWYPFNAVCENCKKIGTTRVYKWDGQKVHYHCEPVMVKWAVGCGHEGQVSPYDGRGKLNWKVEWAAKWKTIGVTVEGAGKDHMSAGGSHDIASEISRKVLHYPVPYPFSYEFFVIGGRKMSSSKGRGVSAQEVSQILPPDVFRFLIVRTPVERALDFNPYGDTILNLFDDYDRCMSAYFDKLEDKLPEGKPGEVLSDFARIFELSAVRPLPQVRLFVPRFRTIVNLVETKSDLLELFEKQKGSPLTSEEKEILEERVVYAEKYLKEYKGEAPKDESKIKLTEKQGAFLATLSSHLENSTYSTPDELQEALFNLIKENQISPKEAFQAIYTAILQKPYGPKAAQLLYDELKHDQKSLTGKLVGTVAQKKAEEKSKSSNKNLSFDKSIFSIDPKIKQTWSSISVGIAIIKGVSIKKNDDFLSKAVKSFVDSQRELTSELIGKYPEILSYRKMYREMGIDWHSRRPSTEALLRRIALKKGLYSINTCVDAYNLVVMKNRVSAGAFDLDKIAFPTVLRFAKEGEKILLLGDKEPTSYKSLEVAYFDKLGGYNIDFNYRDAIRTAVTEKTKNLFINVDGVHDITRQQVEQTLGDTIDTILKYCGGKVEVAGIVE